MAAPESHAGQFRQRLCLVYYVDYTLHTVKAIAAWETYSVQL